MNKPVQPNLTQNNWKEQARQVYAFWEGEIYPSRRRENLTVQEQIPDASFGYTISTIIVKLSSIKDFANPHGNDSKVSSDRRSFSFLLKILSDSPS